MSISLPQIQTIHKASLGRLIDLRSVRDIGDSHGDGFDGVYCGLAKSNSGTIVFVLQDYSYKGGSCGTQHANQISLAIETAIEQKVPLLMMLETGGARIQEGQRTMTASTTALQTLSKASGYIPTIAVIMGTCAGLGAYFSSICDCTVFIENKSMVFMTGPKVVSTAIGKKITKEALGGTDMHAVNTGIPTQIAKDLAEAQDIVGHLLERMPPCCEQNMKPKLVRFPKRDAAKEARCCGVLPGNDRSTYDMHRIVSAIVDDGTYIDFYPRFARNLITGLAALSGRTVGIIANQPKVISGALDVKSAIKFTRFIQVCDAYNIPMIFLVDCPGFIPGIFQESLGSVNEGGKASHMLRSCQAPKITVLIRRIIGGAYAVMNSVSIGADYTLAWPGAEIAIMSKEAAGTVSEHAGEDCLEHAQGLGIVDNIIPPENTRTELVRAINIVLRRKRIRPLNKRRIVLPI